MEATPVPVMITEGQQLFYKRVKSPPIAFILVGVWRAISSLQK